MVTELSNPLNLEERLFLPRLFMLYIPNFLTIQYYVLKTQENYIRSVPRVVLDNKLWKRFYDKLDRLSKADGRMISNCVYTVDILTQDEKIIMKYNVDPNIKNDPSNQETLTNFLEDFNFLYTLPTLENGKLDNTFELLKVRNPDRPALQTNWDIFSELMDHIVKEAYFGQKIKEPKSKKIELLVDKLATFPEDAFFVPEDAKNYKEFLPFKFDYTGQALPDKEELKYLLSRPPQKIQAYLSWYSIGLLSRTLRAPISAKSEEADYFRISGLLEKWKYGKEVKRNIITLYHPIF